MRMSLPMGVTVNDVMCLSEMAGDSTTYSRGWGAWMASCAAFLKGAGYAEGCYRITQKGIDLLDELGRCSG